MIDKDEVREIFVGGDKKWGLEICKGLRGEDLGVPVIYQNEKDVKVNKIDLQNSGDRDENYRYKIQPDENLLGYVLPVDASRSEFVFISAGDEQGMVFQEVGERWKQIYMNEGVPFLLGGNNTSFVEMINSFSLHSGNKTCRYVLKEDSDYRRYAEIVEMAVQGARQRKTEITKNRGDNRKSLFKKLFGGVD